MKATQRSLKACPVATLDIHLNKASNLGYCELFHFKFAGDRTCDAWLVGGPIT
jgi:hypothetical protein